MVVACLLDRLAGGNESRHPRMRTMWIEELKKTASASTEQGQTSERKTQCLEGREDGKGEARKGEKRG